MSLGLLLDRRGPHENRYSSFGGHDDMILGLGSIGKKIWNETWRWIGTRSVDRLGSKSVSGLGNRSGSRSGFRLGIYLGRPGRFKLHSDGAYHIKPESKILSEPAWMNVGNRKKPKASCCEISMILKPVISCSPVSSCMFLTVAKA